MHRFGCVTLLVASFLGGNEQARADDPGASEPETPEWIWAESIEKLREVQFARSFHLESAPIEARMKIAADFCDVIVEINRQPILSVEAFAPTVTYDVTRYLVPGDNQIRLIATYAGGPEAVALSIDATSADGDVTRLVTDESWTAGLFLGRALHSLGHVAPEMWGSGARPARISPLEDYTQWKRALGDGAESDSGRFWTVDGFEIELVRAAAEDQGSWVALVFDDAGRLTIAREDRGLLRLTFDEQGGSVAEVETINDELLECRGLVYVDGDLYANANNSRALYRLRDTDGDGEFDETTVVREFPGSVGHGRNQLAAHGGAIWSICGDGVDVPTDMLDRTSPFREARQGEMTREGFLARYDLETEEWELFCAGLRNPFGVAFNRDGEAFTYDADAEYDMGAPWYRPTRVVHLRSGADYGWRGVTKQWPPYDPDHPDNAQPLLDIGKGSPTAVDFGYDSNFPPVYREALYLLDWAYGRVLAVHVTPRGGTYRAQAETFLQGSPLNVTGIDFGPDGAMYLVTGGRNTKSALYRVKYVGEPVEEPVASAHALSLEEHAREARGIRRRLESLHLRADADAFYRLLDALWSHDPSISQATHTAIEHREVELPQIRDISADAIPSVLVSLRSLAASERIDTSGPVLERLLTFPFTSLRVRDQLTLLHAISLFRQWAPSVVNERRDVLLEYFDPHFPDHSGVLRVSAYGTSIEVNRELARLLVDLDAPGIVERCVAELERSTAQEDRLHYLFLLRYVESGWTAETQRAYFSALREADQFVAGEGMPTFLELIREAATERLSPSERTQLASLLEAVGVEEPAATIDRPLVREWTFEELAEAVSESDHQPSAKRGGKIYQQALCVRCHRVGARGPAVGPDLTYVGRRFSREDILQSILLPDRVVAENYRNLEVVTTDGRVITGRPLTSGDYRSPTVSIAVNPLRPSEIVELSKQEIDISRMSDTSPMPAGLLNTFTVEEIIDLLAYVAGQR